TPQLVGAESPAGPTYNADEPLPAKIALPSMPVPEGGLANKNEVKGIMDEIDTIPPVKPSDEATTRLKVEALPPFSAKVLADYRPDTGKGPLREAVRKAIQALEKQSKTFPDSFQVPGGNEAEFKKRILEVQRGPAIAERQLKDALDEMKEASKDRKNEKSK